MAKLYHNVTGSTGVDVELLPAGSNVGRIGSIVVTNTSSSVISIIGLRLYNDTTQETFQIQAKVTLPVGVTLIIDDQALLNFDNSRKGFGLFAFVSNNTECDILINTI
jgi:hypothetical protein